MLASGLFREGLIVKGARIPIRPFGVPKPRDEGRRTVMGWSDGVDLRCLVLSYPTL